MPEGSVVAFDDHRGLGEIETLSSKALSSKDGESRRYPFHCTQVADGTRTIAVGTAVTFEVAPGPLGPEEAVAIVKLC